MTSTYEALMVLGALATAIMSLTIATLVVIAIRQFGSALGEMGHDVKLGVNASEHTSTRVKQLGDFSKIEIDNLKAMHTTLRAIEERLDDLYQFSDEGLAPSLAAHLEAMQALIAATREGQTVHMEPQPYPEARQQAPQEDVVTWGHLRELGERKRAEEAAAEQERQRQQEIMRGMARKAPAQPHDQVQPEDDRYAEAPGNSEGRRLTTEMDEMFRKMRGGDEA